MYMSFVFVLFILLQISQSLKVLVTMPGITKSIMLFNSRVTDILIAHGHEVHHLVTHLAAKVPYHQADEVKSSVEFQSSDMFPDWKKADSDIVDIYTVMAYGQMTNELWALMGTSFSITKKFACESVYNASMVEEYKRQEFDVVVAHVYGDTTTVGLAEQLQVPVLWMSGGNYILERNAISMSLPFPSSYVTNAMSPESDVMSSSKRMINALTQVFMMVMHSYQTNDIEAICYAKNFPGTKDIRTLASEIPQLLLNGESLIDFPRPIASFVHYIGELTPAAFRQSLSTDWNKFVSPANDGLILFSLGSVANTTLMPAQWRLAFLQAFSEFKTYRIIWKFDGHMPDADIYEHIRISSWVPQRELLAHKSMKLFITHGGYNSVLESSHSGVPSLMMPLFLDQLGNAQRGMRLGMTLVLDKKILSKQLIVNSMKEVLMNNKFTERAQFISSVMGEHVASPENMLVHRIERSAKMRNRELLTWNYTLHASKKLGMLQYYGLDTILIPFILFETMICISVFY